MLPMRTRWAVAPEGQSPGFIVRDVKIGVLALGVRVGI
jgi:hypothetical protein